MSTNTNRIINADNIMYGDKKVNKVYMGDTQLWERTFIYGWHVNPNESDPDNAITYLNDAVDKNIAEMTTIQQTVKGYRDVEYIQSTGTQYIFTDIVPTYDYKTIAEIGYSTLQTTGEQSIFGTYAAETATHIPEFGGSYTMMLAANSQAFWGNPYVGFGWRAEDDSIRTIDDINSSTTKTTVILSKSICSVGNIYVDISSLQRSQIAPKIGLTIFGSYNVFSSEFQPFSRANLKVYSFKIYDIDENLINNLIPVERISDNELGLIDTITGKFYSNAGTGTFVKGSYVITNSWFDYGDWKNAFFMPKPCMLKSDGTVDYYLDPDDYSRKLVNGKYRALEYIQGTGTQYIETDIVPNYQMKLETNLQFGPTTDSSGNGGIIGNIADNQRFAILAAYGSNDNLRFYFYSGYPWSSSTFSDYSFWLDNSQYTQKLTYILSRNLVQAGTQTSTDIPPVSQSQPSSDKKLLIGAMKNTDGRIYTYSLTDFIKIYDFKLYDENDVLIHNLIPVERISDNELGLYDTIDNKFYSNVGTGSFIKGNYISNSDISDASYDGNAMMEWPKIWYKFVAGSVIGEGSFYCSNKQVDSSYKCWCNYDYYGNQIDHFYTAIYNGTGTTKLRSLSDIYLTEANGSGNVATSTEIANAEANNTGANKIWYIGQFADRILINSLLVLISKSLNTRAKFGNGLIGNDNTTIQNQKENYKTGTLNDKGLFYGSTSVETEGMKVFGMENWWGCVFHRIGGLIANDNDYYIKLTRSTTDGTTVTDYSFTDPTGYLTEQDYLPTTSGNISKMMFTSLGYLPCSTTNGSISTYWCNWLASLANQNNFYALMGGVLDTRAGAFELDFTDVTNAWSISSTLSCKPLYITQNEP